MTAAADLTAAVVVGITGLGVPWWGWTALVVMIFWGLLGPSEPAGEPLSAEEPFPGRG